MIDGGQTKDFGRIFRGGRPKRTKRSEMMASGEGSQPSMLNMMKLAVSISFLLLLSAAAFAPAPRNAFRTTRTRLWDSEKPEPPAATQSIDIPPVSDTTTERAVRKVTSLDKELWFDEETGKFYEACPSERIPLATIFERTIDTIEDAVVHARRIPYEKGWIDDKVFMDKKRPTVVVLGSGWASHALIKVADSFRMRLIVVSPCNHFVFTPSK